MLLARLELGQQQLQRERRVNEPADKSSAEQLIVSEDSPRRQVHTSRSRWIAVRPPLPPTLPIAAAHTLPPPLSIAPPLISPSLTPSFSTPRTVLSE
jgi:hypothetical protein